VIVPFEIQSASRYGHTGDQRRRARTEALADRNIVVDLQANRRHGPMLRRGDLDGRLPDQIALIKRD